MQKLHFMGQSRFKALKVVMLEVLRTDFLAHKLVMIARSEGLLSWRRRVCKTKYALRCLALENDYSVKAENENI